MATRFGILSRTSGSWRRRQWWRKKYSGLFTVQLAGSNFTDWATSAHLMYKVTETGIFFFRLCWQNVKLENYSVWTWKIWKWQVLLSELEKIWDWRVLLFELGKYETEKLFCLNSEYMIRRVLLFKLGKSKGAKSFCFPWQLSLILENVCTNLSLRCYAWRLQNVTLWLYVYLHQLVFLILKQG